MGSLHVAMTTLLPIDAPLIAACTDATLLRAALFAPHLNAAMQRYGIDTPRRVAHFLAQISVESGRLTRLEESLNYSIEGLVSTFGLKRISLSDAQKFGRAPGRQANQSAIANIVYGGEFGRTRLGNTQAGDGYRYRGRGLKQLTGRDNYAAYQRASGHPVLTQPDLLLEPSVACDSAAWFWSSRNCNAMADANKTEALSRVINGGTNGLAERIAVTNKALRALRA